MHICYLLGFVHFSFQILQNFINLNLEPPKPRSKKKCLSLIVNFLLKPVQEVKETIFRKNY